MYICRKYTTNVVICQSYILKLKRKKRSWPASKVNTHIYHARGSHLPRIDDKSIIVSTHYVTAGHAMVALLNDIAG